VWTQRQVWTGVENIAPPAFDAPTVHPVASRCTNYSIPAHNLKKLLLLLLLLLLFSPALQPSAGYGLLVHEVS
jgi:hypothetical protein